MIMRDDDPAGFVHAELCEHGRCAAVAVWDIVVGGHVSVCGCCCVYTPNKGVKIGSCRKKRFWWFWISNIVANHYQKIHQILWLAMMLPASYVRFNRSLWALLNANERWRSCRGQKKIRTIPMSLCSTTIIGCKMLSNVCRSKIQNSGKNIERKLPEF